MTTATVVSLEQGARARPSRLSSPASPTPATSTKHTQVSQKDMLYIVVKLCQAALSAVLHRRQWQRRRRRAAGATRLIHEIAAMSRISNGQVRSARKSAICGAKVDNYCSTLPHILAAQWHCRLQARGGPSSMLICSGTPRFRVKTHEHRRRRERDRA